MRFKNPIKKITKWALLLISVFLVLVITLILFSQSSWFKSYVKNQLVSLANDQLNAVLSVGSLEGNLATGVVLKQVTLTRQADTLASIASLQLEYKPLSLLKQQILVNTLNIDSAYVHIKKDRDGSINLTEIAKPGPPSSKDETSGFNWAIHVEGIRFNHGRVDLELSPDSVHVFRNISFGSQFHYQDEQFNTGLDNLGLYYTNQDLTLERLDCLVNGFPDSLVIDDIVLQLPPSALVGSLVLNTGQGYIQSLQVNATPLSLDQVRNWVTLPVTVNLVDANVDYIRNSRSQNANLWVKHNDQSIDLNAQLQGAPEQGDYELLLRTHDLNIHDWLQLSPDVKTSIINSEFKVRGSGIDLQTASLDFSLRLHNSLVHNYRVQEMVLKGIKRGPKIDVALQELQAPLDMDLKGSVALGDTLQYVLDLALHDFHYPLLDSTDRFQFTLHDKGEWSGNYWRNRFSIQSDSLLIGNIPTSRVSGSGSQNGSLVNIDSLYINSALGNLVTSGTLNTSGYSDLEYNYYGADFSKVYPQIPLRFDGGIYGQITGMPDSLSVVANLNMQNIIYDSSTANSLTGIANLDLIGSQNNANGNIDLASIRFSGNAIDSLSLQAAYNNEQLRHRLGLYVNDSTRVWAVGETSLADTLSIRLDTLKLYVYQALWKNKGRPVVVHHAADWWEFNHFNLLSGTQRIGIDGHLATQHEQDLTLRVDSLNIGPFANLLLPGHQLTGNLGTQIQLGGYLNDLRGSGQIILKNVDADQLRLGRLAGNFTMHDRLLDLDIKINKDSVRVLNIDGSFPLAFLPQDSVQGELPPFVLKATSNGMDLDMINLALPNEMAINGRMEMDLTFRKNQSGNSLDGFMNMHKARFYYLPYNAGLENVELQLNVDNNQARLDMRSQKNSGNLKSTGTFTLSPTFQPENIDIDLGISKYKLANTKKLVLTTNADLNLSGTAKQPLIQGQVNVQEAKVYLPALQSRNGSSLNGNTPILAEHIEQDSSKQKQQTAGNGANNSSFETRIKVIFDRNIWVRNEDMNIELSGNIDILKPEQDLLYFGQINVVRGMLNLYGKRFDLKNGQINLQGNKELNPSLDIQASHTFRDNYKEKHTLTVNITGNVKNPIITFELDDQSIDQTNAVSLLLFGRRTGELSYGEKKQMSENNSVLSTGSIENWVTSRLTAPITRSIQNRLDLDVIEFKGGSDWRQASIVLGKYLTTDLYLSYLQEFNLGQSHELATEQISLEYEINRFLFLQATKGDDKSTGIDIVVKYEK